ncbi:vacuolar protein 8-like [Colossoma macropomum]|uniref:vacuolar protein 8-like n=1 Tax=Colossoma macropomum TaxID=42526 RepID=UPI0018652D58|nr:vacuolar protein 8-like [Colossoma macropomum]
MGLCDRCARLLDDFKSLVKAKAAIFVQKLKDVVNRISECCCSKKALASQEKLHELLRRHDVKSRPSHLTTAQSRVPAAFLETCCTLLQSEDMEVQRTVSLSMLNLLTDSKIKEEHVIEMGVLEPLVDLLQSGDRTVQCNSSACIALLASSDSNREAIVSSDAVLPLLVLARAFDPKVQQNAVRALHNLTKSEKAMCVLCEEGVIPVLALLLQSADSDVQFYSCSALSNIAAAPKHHSKLLQIGDRFLLKSLVSLMGSSVLKNSTQACGCLRSLIGNGEAQRQLVGLDWVYPLLTLLKAPELSSSEAAVMLLSELSAHPLNKESLVNQGVVPILGELLLMYLPNSTLVTHCAITLTHLWDIVASQETVLETECLTGLLLALGFDWNENDNVLSILACLHSLASFDSLRSRLIEKMTASHVGRLVSISSESENSDLSFAAGSVISKLDMNDKLLKPHHRAIVGYLMRFLRNQEVRFQQLAIASVYNLKKGGGLDGMTCGLELERELNRVQQQTEHTRQLLQMLQQDTCT